MDESQKQPCWMTGAVSQACSYSPVLDTCRQCDMGSSYTGPLKPIISKELWITRFFKAIGDLAIQLFKAIRREL